MIERVFNEVHFYLPAIKDLRTKIEDRKTKRRNFEMKLSTGTCIELLKEKRFVELEAEIKDQGREGEEEG